MGCFMSMALLTTGCLKDSCNREVTYVKPVPVYKTLEEIRIPISVEPAQTILNAGKIYTYENYLFINDYLKGIHVIDNSDPSNPTPINFISIAGNVDIAVKDGVLYADNYIDLLAINIQNIQQPFVEKRIENSFPPEEADSGNGILVAYEGDEVTEKVDCDWDPDPSWRLLQDSADPSFSGATGGDSRNVFSGTTGVAGSMAQFAVVNGYLYVIDSEDMYLFDISNASNPTAIGEVNVGNGIETIFPYKDNLFIGANNGMYIYDNTTPSNPTFVSRFEHFTACDPVVVEGNYAYVTLRNNEECGSGWRDELQVINISNLQNPYLAMAESDVREPMGLAVSDKTVYLCDGVGGIKVYNHLYSDAVTTVEEESFLLSQHLQNVDAFDAIAVPNTDLLLIIGENGLTQYDKSNPTNLSVLSHISF